MQRKFDFEVGECYHIFNRGVEKRAIFQQDSDWVRFQDLLYLANGDKPLIFKLFQGLPLEQERGNMHASIIAYSLMPNHFHMIGREDKEAGLSRLMGKLSTSYSMYFNVKYERSGHLLCHPFRARHIDSDDYLRWVLSYVHLNPLDIMDPGWLKRGSIDCNKAVKFLQSFAFSSYPDYFLEERKVTKIINKSALPIEIDELESVEEMLKELRDPPESSPLTFQG
ncbi:MAG: transposase [bacterium]|nr:transposase [bacterium]